MRKCLIYCLLGLVFLLPACQEIEIDGTIIQEGEPILLEDSQSTEFSIFEIVTLDLGEGTFTNGQLEATTLEGDKIPIIIQDGILTFMVPKLNQGEYKLVFKENNKPFNIPFKVKPHDLKESPETMLANYQQESQDQLLALERTKDLLQGAAKEALERDIETLRNYTEEKLAKSNTLTPDERADMAFFLQANASWINEVSDAVNAFAAIASNARTISNRINNDIVNVEDRSEQIINEFLIAKTRVIKKIPGIIGVFALGTLAGGPGVGLALSGLVVAKFSWNFIRLMGSIDNVFEFIRLVEEDGLSVNSRASYIFSNGNPTELAVSREYRTVYSGDADSPIPFVKAFIVGFRELLQTWNELVAKVPVDLSYQPNDFTQRTEFQAQTFRVHSNHLSISGITNDKVTGSATKENGKLLLNFNTAETDAQEFDFKLSYNHTAFGQLEKTLDAAVVNEGCSLTLELRDKNKVTATATGYGPFTFIYPAGQKEADKTTEILASTFGEMVVKIKDQNGCESEAKIDIPCTLKIDVLNTDNTYTIEALDGLPPFSYNWSNGATAKTQSLPPGTHVVTVSDALGCKIEHTISINCNLEVNIQKDGNNVTAQASGGTPPYTYTWSDGATEANRNNLNPGTYTVTVTDKVGCQIIKELDIKNYFLTAIINGVQYNFNNNPINAKTTGSIGSDPYWYQRICGRRYPGLTDVPRGEISGLCIEFLKANGRYKLIEGSYTMRKKDSRIISINDPLLFSEISGMGVAYSLGGTVTSGEGSRLGAPLEVKILKYNDEYVEGEFWGIISDSQGNLLYEIKDGKFRVKVEIHPSWNER